MSSLYSYYGGAAGTANDSIVYNDLHPELQNMSKSDLGSWDIAGAGTISVLPTDNVVYISYYMYNYEYPDSISQPPEVAIFNKSRLAYVSGILALDNDGRLLWNNPTDSMIMSMAANNSTIDLARDGGRIFATQANIALGFALIAVVYLFLRFFCVGAVARARSRIDKNENLNCVMRYVVAKPGSTLREISRGMRMNLGTVRYHIFILGLNHRIVAYQADGKHVRYFINSGTYSKEEQMIMSDHAP